MIELSEAEQQFSEWLDKSWRRQVSFMWEGFLLAVVVAVVVVAGAIVVSCSCHRTCSVLSVVFARSRRFGASMPTRSRAPQYSERAAAVLFVPHSPRRCSHQCGLCSCWVLGALTGALGLALFLEWLTQQDQL